MDDSAENWETPDQNDVPPKKERLKRSKTPAEIAAYRPGWRDFDENDAFLDKKGYGFLTDTASETDLMFMEDDMFGTNFHKHVKAGFKKKWVSPEMFYFDCLRYFKASDSTPWHRNEMLKSGPEAGRIVAVPTRQPYTIKAMCVFLGINEKLFNKMKSEEDFIQFHEVCEQIEAIIYNDQFVGAAVGAYNPNVVSKNLGLTEKTENKTVVEAEFTIVGMKVS